MSARRKYVVRFGSTLRGPTTSVTSFETQLSEYLHYEDVSLDDMAGSHLILDLSDVTYMDPYSMQILVAYISKFLNIGIDPRLELPDSEDVNRVMRIWGLDYALLTAADRSLWGLATQESVDKHLAFRDLNQRKLDLRGLYPRVPNANLTSSSRFSNRMDAIRLKDVPRAKFFPAFHAYDMLDIRSKSLGHVGAIKDERALWTTSDVKRYFRIRCGIDVEHLSARVIWEAMFNAMRHPEASITQTATHISAPSKNGMTHQSSSGGDTLEYILMSEAEFPEPPKGSTTTFHFWDDGECMIDVLRRRLKDAESSIGGVDLLRTGPKDDYFTRYKVQHLKDGRIETEGFIDSSETVTEKASSANLIAAMTFPYFSSLPKDPGFEAPADYQIENKDYAARGMGLYNLVRTVVGTLGGKVSVRTGNSMVKIEKNLTKDRNKSDEFQYDFRLKVQSFPDNLPKFNGNLIAAQIPT